MRQRHVTMERDKLAGEAGHLLMCDQIVAHFAGLHRRRSREDRVKIIILDNQLGRSLGADAGHARNVINSVTHKRENVTKLIGADAKLLLNIVGAAPFIFHGIEHVHARTILTGQGNKLHQILVGRYDRDVPPRFDRAAGVSRYDIICLETGFFYARQ